MSASPEHPAPRDLRVLVLAPFGRDAEVTCEVLREAGIACHACVDLAELGREAADGAGAIVLTAEALGPDGAAVLARVLDAQAPWSSLPVVLATAPRSGTAAQRDAAATLERASSVTILERPVGVVTLRTVVRSALRERQRQYELRHVLDRLRENLERLDAERVVRERFVSLLAHDLRGPLGAATLAARMLVSRPERLQERYDLAVRIERNMSRIDDMVGALLDANRLRAGQRLSLSLRPCDLVEVAADVVAELDDTDRARVRTSAPDRLEGVWSPDELTRALWNLVSNALKYGSAGSEVAIALARAGDEATVSVHNEGPPIPAEEHAALFEPFGRARGADARARGWGLGLTLVRGCAEAHGGTIELSSDASGTTFTLRLPLDARPFQAAGG